MGRLRASCWELPLASPLFVHDLTRLQSLAQLSAQPLPMQPTLTLLCTSIHHSMPQQGTTIFCATSRQGHRPTSQSSPQRNHPQPRLCSSVTCPSILRTFWCSHLPKPCLCTALQCIQQSQQQLRTSLIACQSSCSALALPGQQHGACFSTPSSNFLILAYLCANPAGSARPACLAALSLRTLLSQQASHLHGHLVGNSLSLTCPTMCCWTIRMLQYASSVVANESRLPQLL